MSRVRNAGEFRLTFREIYARYETIFGPRLAEVRARLSADPTGQASDAMKEHLEAHGRAYVVNSLLAALNWRSDVSAEDGLPNLFIEVAVDSLERGRRRFLDYLGVERDTDAPLLIVETKRPNSELPRLAELGGPMPATYSEIISRGLAGERLLGDWTPWLNDLRDYVRSVQARSGAVPPRVVSTNGDWLLVFLDPADAFIGGGQVDANKILVIRDRSELEE